MSELKAIDVDKMADVRSLSGRFYRKSEADKYIALLKDKANYNEEANKLKSEKLADTCIFYEEKLRHQKWKRCLAMAAMCWERRWRVEFDYAFWHRWGERWLELAEKFKEAK